MLTWRDFLDYCDLSEEEVAQIAETEHLPPIVAAQYALLRRHGLDALTNPLMHERSATFLSP